MRRRWQVWGNLAFFWESWAIGALIRFLIFCYGVYLVARWLRNFLYGAPPQQPRGTVPPPSGARPPATPSAYEVLGVVPGASPEEIRAAYQALVRQYHPDQVAHLGPELRDVAERRTKEINAAYNTLKRN